MKKTNNTAAQPAEQTKGFIDLSALSCLDTNNYIQDEDGIYIDRENIQVQAVLSYETEDYVRIIKTISAAMHVYRNALLSTYGESEGHKRYASILPQFKDLLNAIGHDMGLCMAERLGTWGENYI